jgi:hypothetical protein
MNNQTKPDILTTVRSSMKIKTCLFIADQNLKKAKKKSRTDQEQPKKKEVENNAFLDDR